MVKIGILGAGGIAQMMAKTLHQMEDAVCYAVGSRELQKAQEFADKHQVEKAYGSYEQLAADEEVELIYIATPHSHHYEHARLCIENGKAVLCEKAFMVNAGQARELAALAGERGVFLAEAIWPRYMPSREMITELIAADRIGEVTSLTANMGGNLVTIPRIYDPGLAGGALLDVGIYTLTFASMVLGDDIVKITSAHTKLPTGVDGQNAILLEYPGGKMAALHSSVMAQTDQSGIVYGTKGYLIARHIANIDKIEVYSSHGELVKVYAVPEQITGYEYEVAACIRAIRKGELTCPEAPLKQSIHMMEVMDELRSQWGLRYPFE